MLISVIMPAYNVENFIAKSIESILQQTYREFELLVINDGSIDHTKDKIKAYQQQDSRVRYFEEENSGVAAARNLGIQMARGEYIAFLDADDSWDRTYLETMAGAIAADPQKKFLYAKTREHFLDGHENIVAGDNLQEGRLADFVHHNNELRLPLHISALMIKKQLIDQYGVRFESGIRMSEDTGFLIELLCVAPLSCVPETLTTYFRREASATTRAWNPEIWEGTVVIYERIEAFVRKNAPKTWPVFTKIRDYHVYRFVLQCVKRGYLVEARNYAERWHAWLKEFSQGDGRLNDRVKCRLLMRKSLFLFKLLGRL